jgi:hypothetical protein
MDRRALLLFLSMCALSGCATAPVEVPKMTPAQSYEAGLLNVTRGDYAAARRDWDRCLAMTTPESSERGDCLAALEQLPSLTTQYP